MSQQSVPSVSSVLAVRDAAAMRSISPFRSSASDGLYATKSLVASPVSQSASATLLMEGSSSVE